MSVPMVILADWLIPAADETPKQGWGVRVADGKVDAVAAHSDLLRAFPDDPVHDGRGTVIAPGFVNAHTHLYGVLAHGIPLDRAPADFWGFLADFWWPLVEDALDSEMICAATDWACMEMVRGGTTTFYDCLEAPFALPGILRAQRDVVLKRGLRAILSFEATQRIGEENGLQGLQENAEFVDLCRRAGGLVHGLICFHTTFTCSADFIRAAFDLAASMGVPVHMHCNEGIHEPEYAIRHFGMRTLEYYESLGVAGPNMLASQCVQLSPGEQTVIAEHGIRTVHMPLSNCEVGGGIAPIPDLLEAGVISGLGSDGYVNDFYEVMRGAFLIHKAARRDPRVMPARQVWYMATEGGARALGLERVGRLEPGWVADLQLVKADLPTPLSQHNLLEQLLLWRTATDVQDVMVAGHWQTLAGEVLGVERDMLRTRLHAAATRMWAKARSS